MNERTATLIRKVAAARENTTPRYIRSLKRTWYSLNQHERTEKRKEWQQEVQKAKKNEKNGNKKYKKQRKIKYITLDL